jgi:uncharacterized damage-inducible protein DinB
MNKQILNAVWDQFRQIHGVTVRAIECIPDSQLDAKPIPGMRSVRELVDHMYAYVRGVPGAVLRGELREEDCPSHAARLASKKDLIAYANESFQIADQAIAKIDNSHLDRMVPTNWGRSMPGGALIQVIYDEHLHHRGQFYAYLRALGAQPPFLWSFQENAPEYQPRAMTT